MASNIDEGGRRTHGDDDDDDESRGVTDRYGIRRWFDEEGQLHRDHDRPAAVWPDGTMHWYQHGKRHRDHDRSALIRSGGSQHWYQNGKRHRDGDRPAVIRAGGTERWYQNGKRHRDGDRPAVILINGTMEWWLNGKRHRDGDGPAVVRKDGSKEWYQNGQKHRGNDEPAVILPGGAMQWYKHGQLHRDGDEPAEIWSYGAKRWYKNHQMHRLNGPAAITGKRYFWWRVTPSGLHDGVVYFLFDRQMNSWLHHRRVLKFIRRYVNRLRQLRWKRRFSKSVVLIGDAPPGLFVKSFPGGCEREKEVVQWAEQVERCGVKAIMTEEYDSHTTVTTESASVTPTKIESLDEDESRT